MESFVFNSFKERLMKGEVLGDDTWTLHLVNKKFTEDYEDNLKYIHSANDIYYLNKNYKVSSYNNIVDNFAENYYTKMQAVEYLYTPLQKVDVATEPQYVSKENYDDFTALNTNEAGSGLYNLFFVPGYNTFYRVDYYKDELDENGETYQTPVPRGFYYVKTKEDLKWCADKVNGANYNNAINIVLGDNIGTDATTAVADDDGNLKVNGLTDINYSIGSNPNQPFEGVFYGNGFCFKNINLICENNTNGIIGHLGTSGVISTVRVEGNYNNLTCRKKISISHLQADGTDVYAGFICGKNYGYIERVDINGTVNVVDFVPEIYSVSNKTDNNSDGYVVDGNEDINIFYPDYLCFNSLGNIIPYIGYFNEGVFATYAGRSKIDNIIYDYWKTSGTARDAFVTKIYTNHNSMTSPAEWYYFDGFYSTVYNGYIETMNKFENKKDILFYDTGIFSQINDNLSEESMFRPAASSAAVLPINFKPQQLEFNQLVHSYGQYGYMDIRKKREELNQYEFIERAPYFDKSIKMQQQNRVAYYVSPLIGLNRNVVKYFNVNATIKTSGTFVGFIGGIAGKQLNGEISEGAVTITSKDDIIPSGLLNRLNADDFNTSAVYHRRNYYHSKNKAGDLEYYFPLQSIKNIGGLFGECVVVGGRETPLNIRYVSAFLENQNARLCYGGTQGDGTMEDYYFFDKYATITPIVEYDNANITDCIRSQTTRISKYINLYNSVFTYNESLSKEDEDNDVMLRLKLIPGDASRPSIFKQVFNLHGNNFDSYYPYSVIAEGDDGDDMIAMESTAAYRSIDGAASPLVCEIKPTFQVTPSIIQTLFANGPYINYSGFLEDWAHYAAMYYDDETDIRFGYNSAVSGYNITTYKPNYRIGLFGMDQNLASPVSNPEFYSINLATDIPGVKNPVANSETGTSGTVFDRFNRPDAITATISLDIRDTMKNIFNWDRCKVTNNHNVWHHPVTPANYPKENIFKYTVVPRAAKLPQTFDANINGVVSSISSIDQMQENDYIISSGYNGNKIPYSYAYFGSDVSLERQSVSDESKIKDTLSNVSGYILTLKNPLFGTPLNSDSNEVQIDIVSAYKVYVDLGGVAVYNSRYKVHAITANSTDEQNPGSAEARLEQPIQYLPDTIRYSPDADEPPISQYNTYDYLISGTNNRLNVSGFHVSFEDSYSNGGVGTSRTYVTAHGVLLCDFTEDSNPNGHDPLKDWQWTHMAFLGRGRGSDHIIRQAYNVPLAIDNVELILKNETVSQPKYIIGYKVDSNNEWLEDIVSDTPPALYSAYIKQCNYTNAQTQESINEGYSAVPANENNEEINNWANASITTLIEPLSIKITNRGLIAPYGNKPDLIYYKTGDTDYPGPNTNPPAVWSAAIAQNIRVNRDGTTTEFSAIFGNTHKSFITEDEALSQTIATNAISLVFQYKNFNYLTTNSVKQQPIMPEAWYTKNRIGHYKVDFIGCNNYPELYDWGNLVSAESADNPYTMETREWFPSTNYEISMNNNMSNSDLNDYFKYTYTKFYKNTDIGKSGIKLDVHYDIANNKAGFWFSMHESAFSAYNDDIYYSSNILNIGKTPNQTCILNEHLSKADITSVLFSSFSADDFEGLYVTDSKNLPVMYINVGLGECQDGTTWTYSSYPSIPISAIRKTYSADIDDYVYYLNDETKEYTEDEFTKIYGSISGLMLEVET